MGAKMMSTMTAGMKLVKMKLETRLKAMSKTLMEATMEAML